MVGNPFYHHFSNLQLWNASFMHKTSAALRLVMLSTPLHNSQQTRNANTIKPWPEFFVNLQPLSTFHCASAVLPSQCYSKGMEMPTKLEMLQMESLASARCSFSTGHPSTGAVENKAASLPLPPSLNMWQQGPQRRTSSGTVGFSQTHVTSQAKQRASSPTIKAPFGSFTTLSFTFVQNTVMWYNISYASTNIWVRSTSNTWIPPHDLPIC